MPVFTNIAAYKFAPLEELPELREHLLAKCIAWELKGTILLSLEGINLFIAGLKPEIDLLLAEVHAISGLEDLTPKYSESDHQPFTRMLVRLKKEIIAFGVEGIDPARNPAPRLSARTLAKWLDEGRPVTLLDTRNDYEIKLGTFKDAIPMGIEHFREFPEASTKLPEEMKKQTVVTFCTGGIRCEKAASFLEQRGFEQVFQLDGGILKYFEECGGTHYEGECFVFDKRVSLDPNLKQADAAVCFCCQATLTPQEQRDPRYVPSQSCPHCS
ncbi:MAG: sulfurtransferase [Chthoniobacterales bacterium]